MSRPRSTFSWLACPDCASTVHDEQPVPGVYCITVEHSPTCPAWTNPEREVGLSLDTRRPE